MSAEKSNLTEVTSKERIELVQTDSTRRWGQIIISFILVGSMLSFLGWYTIVKADDEWLTGFADTMQTLVIMGIGAALAIFGLGRTVGK